MLVIKFNERKSQIDKYSNMPENINPGSSDIKLLMIGPKGNSEILIFFSQRPSVFPEAKSRGALRLRKKSFA